VTVHASNRTTSPQPSNSAGADGSSGLVTRHGGTGGVSRRVGLVDGLRDV
jgi:hypothetical protein